jgi:transposase
LYRSSHAKEERTVGTTTQFDTQRVGALPVIAEFCERLQLRRLINDLVPWEGDVPLGDIVEILVANRLLEPKPIYKLGSWATKTTLANFYNLTEEKLHDDCIGRALERIADHGDNVQSALVMRIIRDFDLDVRQVHYDMSTIELHGSYEDYAEGPLDAQTPRPTYGHTKSGRKNVKQIQFGINVVKDGAVPIGHRAFDGNAPESPTHLDNLKRLSQLLPKGDLLYMADSKFDSKENLLAVAARKGKFLSTGALTEDLQQLFLSVKDQLQLLDYHPKSQAHLPAEERDAYRGVEVKQELRGIHAGKPIHCKYRLLFVWSELKARQSARTRQRHINTITATFAQVAKTLNRYQLKTKEKVVRRLETALNRYREGALFHYDVAEDAQGCLTFHWTMDAKKLACREALDGIFVMKTNLAKGTHSTTDVVRSYKEQIQVERRIGNLKGPLAVAPMFLKNPKRMAGLLYILVWALTILSLMERQVRQALKGEPMYGLYPENRPSKAPTGVRLIEAFEYLCIIVEEEAGQVTRYMGQLDPTHRQILRLLDMGPGQMKTFKHRCGT